MWGDDFYDWSEEGACEDAYEDAMSEMYSQYEDTLEEDNYLASLSDDERRRVELTQMISIVRIRTEDYVQSKLDHDFSKNTLQKNVRYIPYYRGYMQGIKKYLVDQDNEEVLDMETLNFEAVRYAETNLLNHFPHFHQGYYMILWNAFYDGFIQGYLCFGS